LLIPINIFGDPICSASEIATGIQWAADPDDGNADIILLNFVNPDADYYNVDIANSVSYARSNGRIYGGSAKGCVVIGGSGNSFEGLFPILK